jgi:hypothetical protein
MRCAKAGAARAEAASPFLLSIVESCLRGLDVCWRELGE